MDAEAVARTVQEAYDLGVPAEEVWTYTAYVVQKRREGKTWDAVFALLSDNSVVRLAFLDPLPVPPLQDHVAVQFHTASAGTPRS